VPTIYTFGPFRLDAQANILYRGTEPVALGQRAVTLLRSLVEQPGALVSKETLIDAAWPGLAIEESNLTVQIAALRRALDGEPDGARWIETLPRRGYRYVGPVVTKEETGAGAGPQSAAPSPLAPAEGGARWDLRSWHLSAPGPRRNLFLAMMPATVALLGAFWLSTPDNRQALVAPSSDGTPPRPGAQTRGIDIPVAILAFTTPVGSPHPGLGERIAHDLAAHLPRGGTLRVVPSRSLSDPTADFKGIGAKLGVRYVVTGTIAAQDEKLQVGVALIDARTGAQTWALHVTEDRNQWPSVHEEFIHRATFAIHFQALRRAGNEPADPNKEPTVRQLLGRGQAGLLDSSDSPRFEEARAAFTEVLRREPESVSAMVGLAAYYIQAVADLRIDREPHLTEAEELLRRALARTTHYYPVHLQLGRLHNVRGNLTAALEELDRVLEIYPSHVPSYAMKGRVLIRLQRYEEALKNIRYAMRLNAGTIVPGWQLWVGWAELELGRDEEALRAFNSALAVLPRNPYVQASLAALHALRGEREVARQHAIEMRKRTPKLTDDQRLIEFNKGPDNRALRNRLGEGLRLAIEIADSPPEH
jgi:DNA-binding winged helix-turn-helix (wHTH) protein/tetratricopeptide (TPR) repeat protein